MRHAFTFFLIVALFIAGSSIPSRSSVALHDPADVPDFSQLSDPLHIPGTVEGTGTHFEIKDSEYLNIALDSSEKIKLGMVSAPEMVIMLFEPISSANPTHVNIRGFVPLTTYYKFEDNYHNLVEVTADENGVHAYTQDLSKRHLVFVQPKTGTKFIKDDTIGGDCSAIGNWDIISKSCTLTVDLSEPIQIDSDGITLDGNGHTVVGTPAAFGLFMNGRTGVTIKNITVRQFNFGIFLFSGTGNTLDGNTVSNNSNFGILLESSSNNLLTNNVANSNRLGIGLGFLSASPNNTLIGNVIAENDPLDVSLAAASFTTCSNTLQNNIGSGGRPIKFFNSQTTISGEILAELILCDADNSNVNNVTIEGSPTLKNNTLFVVFTDSSTLNNIISSNNATGIATSFSTKNTITGGTFLNNVTGIFLNSSRNNTVSNNIISSNSRGLSLLFDLDNSLFGNTISDNARGIIFHFSANNLIYNNNLINNLIQTSLFGSTSDSTVNIFNLRAPTGGNFWSNYDTLPEGCIDTNSDGFCDTPLVVTTGQDNLPWTKQDGWLTISPTISDANQLESDGTTAIPEGGTTDASTIVFKAKVTSPITNTVKLQLELRQFTESFKEAFDPNDGGFLQSELVASGTEVTITRFGLVDGEYKWRARAVDSAGNESEWREFGTHGNVDFVVRTKINAELSWSKNEDPDFAFYKIFRDTNPDIDVNDTPIATISEQATTSFVDRNLDPSPTYFYRVFVFDKAGLFVGSNEVSTQ